MQDKYISLKFCVYALQVLGIVGLLTVVVVFAQFVPGVAGIFTGTVLGVIVMTLCFGAADLLRLLADVERELRGLRDDIHDRFPTPEERVERMHANR